jgi:DNA-binding transcriptional regulator YiaG
MVMGYDADVVHKTNDSTQCVDAQELTERKYTLRSKEPHMDADDIIRRMRQVYDVKHDTELALVLGLSKAAPSNWRQRNSPPYEICVEIAGKKGVSLDWLIFGVGNMRLGVREAMPAQSPHQDAPGISSPRAERLSQFVYWWHVNRTQDEMVWLETQFKRAVPEYGEWLAN